MIWLVFAAMTAVALLALLWPLSRPRPGAAGAADTGGAEAAHVAIYRAQVVEIDRDAEAGRIDATDAQAARTEAARRLVNESQSSEAAGGSPASRRILATGIVLACCLGSALLYTRIGSPALPDAPLADREAPAGGTDLPTALAQIDAHLAKNPDDLRGWTVVAPVYLRMGRVADALNAYANMRRLGGDTADALAGHAEAQVYAAQGTVTAEARRDFEQAVAKDTKQAKARYYLGLAADQDGDRAKARDIWSALAADSPPESPLATALRQRIAEIDGAAMAGEVAALPADAQQAAIRGMVERLATRLHDSGDDIEGWLRLVRAYRVLNEADRARDALADARKHFASDTAATTRLDALARELGLEG